MRGPKRKVVGVAAPNVLEKIRHNLELFVGNRVRLRANHGRKKVMEAEGVLEQIYPKVFVVRLGDRIGTVKRVSYSYADVLTETVELTVCGNEEERRIGCAGM